ncbi:29360_t:CDS:2, partial [Racocetra persica]
CFPLDSLLYVWNAPPCIHVVPSFASSRNTCLDGAPPESVPSGQSTCKFSCPGFITCEFGFPPPDVDLLQESSSVHAPLYQSLGNMHMKYSSISKSSAVGLSLIVFITSIHWNLEYLLPVKNLV